MPVRTNGDAGIYWLDATTLTGDQMLPIIPLAMKAIFCLPAHPSYFDDEYTQAEIYRAIADYDRLIRWPDFQRCGMLPSNVRSDWGQSLQ